MPESPAPSSSDTLPELRALGTRLLEARRSQGLSQDELAEKLRLGTDQLDALEQGDRRRLPEPVFVVAQAKRVAGALGISIDEQVAALRRSTLMEPVRRRNPAILSPEPAETRLAAGQPQNNRSRSGGPAALMPHSRLAAAAVLLVLGLATSSLLLARRGDEAPAGPRISPPPPAAPPPLPAPRP